MEKVKVKIKKGTAKTKKVKVKIKKATAKIKSKSENKKEAAKTEKVKIKNNSKHGKRLNKIILTLRPPLVGSPTGQVSLQYGPEQVG